MNKIPQQTIGTAELSALTGMTKRTLRRHYELGHMPRPTAGRYPFDETIRQLLAHQAARVEAGGGTHLAEKTKLITARREKVEVEFQALRRLYVPLDEVAPILKNLQANQRACLLRVLADESPVKLAYKGPIALRQILADTMDSLCDEFQSRTREWLDAPPSSPATQKAAV